MAEKKTASTAAERKKKDKIEATAVQSKKPQDDASLFQICNLEAFCKGICNPRL